MAGLKDVAQHAGVSVSTVSRVINRNPAISEETAQRVRSSIKALRYTPNSMAKALSTNNASAITLLIDSDDGPSFYNAFFTEVVHGIESVVYKRENVLTIANVRARVRHEQTIDWLVKGRRSDGLIIPSAVATESLIDQLHTLDIPFIVIGESSHRYKNISWIDIDNREAGDDATQFLLDRGCKRLLFIGLDSSKVFSRRRLEGFKLAVNRNRLQAEAFRIIECDNTKHRGFAVIDQLLSDGFKPDGILCADTAISYGVLNALSKNGIVPPDEVKIISFDSNAMAALSYPAISNVHIDVYHLGVRAARLLFEMIDEKDFHHQKITITSQIIERETT